jgi:asparagine synthase (glutamine-hydrolysing)
MCGIVGLISPARRTADPAVIHNMRNLITHRGPDDAGFTSIDAETGKIGPLSSRSTPSAMFGFTRLSIRDLSHRGHQPMVSADGSVVILFNGEIYNTDDLKRKYLSDIQLNSESDTEVLLHLYQKIGIENLVTAVDGMFAIVIYDERTRSTVIARDRFGIKPLYYAHTPRGLAVASEIKPLVATGLIQAEPDLDALGELAMFRYVADPQTPFKNVSSIPPGTIAHVNADATIRFTRFWQPSYEHPTNQRSISNDEGVELLKSTIDQGVQSQFVSDVKVGLELSGGVDSSLLAWAAEGSGLEGYSAIPTLKTLSEESYIDRVCNTTSTASNKISLNPDVIGQSLGEIAYFHETPINHEGSVGVYLVCQQAKEDGTAVLLSGEGADELFGGYHRHRTVSRRMKRAKLVSNTLGWVSSVLPRKIRTAHSMWTDRSQNLTMTTAFASASMATSLFPNIDVENTIARRSPHLEGFDWNRLDESHLIYDQRTYLVDLLVRQDKMSMAHSIETRVPFLGNGIADLASSLPMSQKLGPNQEGKILLKELVAKKFGRDHAYRSKWGFDVPFSFMSGSSKVLEIAERCSAGLVRDGLAVAGTEIFERAHKGDGYASRAAWIMLSIGVWYDINFRGAEVISEYSDLPNQHG